MNPSMGLAPASCLRYSLKRGAGNGFIRVLASEGIAVPMAKRAYARKRAKDQRERGMRVPQEAES